MDSKSQIYKIGFWIFVAVILAFVGYALFTLYPLQTLDSENRVRTVSASVAVFSLMLIAVGLISFYGAMGMGFGNKDNTLSKGDVRLAIVIALITMYIVLTGTVAFFRGNTTLPEVSSTILGHFTNIVGVVIVFYFGTTAYEAVHKPPAKPEEEDEQGQGKKGGGEKIDPA